MFKEIPNTKIFITPGNHDPNIKNSFYQQFKWNENVHIFTNKIERIECDGVEIPKEYYSNINNWDFGVAHQINGIFSKFTLIITPELIKQFNQTE